MMLKWKCHISDIFSSRRKYLPLLYLLHPLLLLVVAYLACVFIHGGGKHLNTFIDYGNVHPECVCDDGLLINRLIVKFDLSLFSL
jgi:hypothetical protein